jgi:hypothetical protein
VRSDLWIATGDVMNAEMSLLCTRMEHIKQADDRRLKHARLHGAQVDECIILRLGVCVTEKNVWVKSTETLNSAGKSGSRLIIMLAYASPLARQWKSTRHVKSGIPSKHTRFVKQYKHLHVFFFAFLHA